MLIEKYLEVVVKQRGSDLHISAGLPPVVRIDGNLQRMDVPALKPEEVELLLFPMLNKEQRRKLEQDWELDFSYGIQGLSRFRVNIYKDRGNYAAAFRVIASKVPSFKELGLSDTVRKIAEKPRGLVLVTGPTGSGKTTTLYAALGEMAKPNVNVITVEDPVEKKVDGINQCQINEKAGMTFDAALRSILRQDPDIIMVGEMRDSETAEIAIRAAITGHMVLSTLHTNDAASTVTRLVDMGVAPYMVATSLIGIVAQRLTKVLCPECKKSRMSRPDENELMGIDHSIEIYDPVGCPRCKNNWSK